MRTSELPQSLPASSSQQPDDQQHPWHALPPERVQALLHAPGEDGLSEQAAEARLRQLGPNRLEEPEGPGIPAILLHQFQSPLIYILILAGVVTLALGHHIDAAVIGVVLLLNAAIGFTQEWRAEASVRALMQLLSPRAHVIRSGRETDIESQSLVPGDLVLLESGNRVPADIRLLSTTALAIDESLLTGESVPAAKTSEALEADAPLAERRSMAYMGTIVRTGRGRGVVVATAGRTALGSIADEIRHEERVAPPLQQRMTRFAHIVGLVVAVSSALAFIIGVLLLGETAADMFLVAVALAVAAVPEGLPVAFTITLALGVRRMARRNAIVRRLAAVETLGSTTVIGTDKTGTLTENRMTVLEIWTGAGTFSLAGDDNGTTANDSAREEAARPDSPLRLTLLAGVLTNEADVSVRDGDIDMQGDPTEAALLMSAIRSGLDPQALRAEFELEAEIPFESARQYSAAYRRTDGERFVFVKGAPERVLEMCVETHANGGTASLDSDRVHAAAEGMASRGLRVLAMAYRRLVGESPHPEAAPAPEHLSFLGLQGMKDPPRAGVREAIQGCREAGLQIIMITGDHGATARAIARELEIVGDDARVITGSELEEMDDETLDRLVAEVAVFARISPEQKLGLVHALQRHGHVVAVTGDGVNDAPALKAAQIGVAMGRSGTDVAREAADMVLTDDNFVSIYAAVEEGRVTFDNVRNVTFFLISTGVAAIITILAALVLRWPLPFLPAQLLWLNLVTNGLQDVALAFEPGEPGVLKRAPRRSDEGILSTLLWERAAIGGMVMAAGTLLLFQWELQRTESLMAAQTVALTTMVVFQNFHIGNSRSEFKSAFRKSPLSNPFLFVAAATALALHVVALHLPATQFVLRVEPIDGDAWWRIVLVAATIVAVIEAHKWWYRRGP